MTKHILETIIEDKQAEIDQLYQEKGLSYFKEKADGIEKEPFLFYRKLSGKGLSLIAEIKKASPSKGIIRKDFVPLELAKEFDSHGAAALSILTEKNYFLGNPDYIRDVSSLVSLPILRKDFIVDPIQVYEAKCIGASAILLIKAALSIETLMDLHSVAREIGLDVLVEIHNEKELDSLIGCGNLNMIGINNRNLNTFDVNINTSLSLAPCVKDSFGEDCLVVAESGYIRSEELKTLEDNEINAVLIGEGLATHSDLLSFFDR